MELQHQGLIIAPRTDVFDRVEGPSSCNLIAVVVDDFLLHLTTGGCVFGQETARKLMNRSPFTLNSHIELLRKEMSTDACLDQIYSTDEEHDRREGRDIHQTALVPYIFDRQDTNR